MNSNISAHARRRKQRQHPRAGREGSGGTVPYVIAAAAVGYGTYVLSRWAWSAWKGTLEEDDMEESEGQTIVRQQQQAALEFEAGLQNESIPPMITDPRRRWRLRRQRMERCRLEASQALRDFLPTFKTAVEQLTDTSEQTKALKNIRANREGSARHPKEKDLWDVVKTKALTRMLATAYGHTILYLLLTLQVHLLGGRLFQEQVEVDQHPNMSSVGTDSLASERMGGYHASHRLVLTQTYDYFFGQGLRVLTDTLQRAVDAVTHDWDATSPASLHTSKESFELTIGEIRARLEGNFSTRRTTRTRSRSILRYLVPAERQLVATCVQDTMAQAILDETWDLTESPVFEDAQRDCLRVTFDLMREKGWSKLFLEKSRPSIVYVDIPLANIVSKLKHTSNTFYQKHHPDPDEASTNPAPNQYVPSLERLPTVLELGDVSFN